MSGKRATDWITSFGHEPIDTSRVRSEFGRRLRKIYSGVVRAPLPVHIVELVLMLDRPGAAAVTPSSIHRTQGRTSKPRQHT